MRPTSHKVEPSRPGRLSQVAAPTGPETPLQPQSENHARQESQAARVPEGLVDGRPQNISTNGSQDCLGPVLCLPSGQTKHRDGSLPIRSRSSEMLHYVG